MDIEQLKCVVAVAERKNFSEASYDIALSQSSISKTIGKVESAFGGIRLFDRSSHHVEITPAGQTFVNYARKLIADFQDLNVAMREHMDLERGRLILGMIPPIGVLGITSLIAEFHRTYPGIDLEFREKDSLELIELLQRFLIDAAILVAPPSSIDLTGITMVPLVQDELVLVTHRFHEYASRDKIRLKEVANEPFVLLPSTSSVQAFVTTACSEAGFSPRIIYESTYFNTILGLVGERLGVSILASKLVRSMPNIACVPLDPPLKHITSLAVSYPSRSRTAEALAKYCSEATLEPNGMVRRLNT